MRDLLPAPEGQAMGPAHIDPTVQDLASVNLPGLGLPGEGLAPGELLAGAQGFFASGLLIAMLREGIKWIYSARQ